MNIAGITNQDTLRIADTEDFTSVRHMLVDAGFSETVLRKRFAIYSPRELFSCGISKATQRNDLLENLLRLFVLEESVKKADLITNGVSSEVCSAMERLDLVRSFPHAPDYYTASVRLQPVGTLILASDRHILTEGPSGTVRFETVYDPWDESARDYLEFLPRKQCNRFLELCAGSGVAALVAASDFAEHAWASDISERCSHFTLFNIRLNAIQNVCPTTGNLFCALKNMEFDYIVVHPPYLPSHVNPCLYRDGGQIGDELITKIVEALPRYLSPGGYFYAHSVVPERRSTKLEDRLRELLGEQSKNFDLAVVTLKETSRVKYCGHLRRQRRHARADVERLCSLFEACDIESFVDCSFLLHRRVGNRPVITARNPAIEPKRLEQLIELGKSGRTKATVFCGSTA
jgi:hypothetical protein